MLSAESIREQINALLSGSISLDDFEDQIVASTWNALKDADPIVRKLVGAIELRLGEYSSGHLDDDDLFTELQALGLHGCVQSPVQAVFISIAAADPTVVTLTNSGDGPDYRFRLEKSQTSPMTRTGSARTIVREPVVLVS